MDQKIEDALYFIYSYAFNINDWKILKKELLKTLPSNYRIHFSTRDAKTKLQNFNKFEGEIVKRWKHISGVDIYLLVS